MVMLSVRALNKEFCTRAFARYMLTKDETTKYGTGALSDLVGPTLHATTITQLKTVFVVASLYRTR